MSIDPRLLKAIDLHLAGDLLSAEFAYREFLRDHPEECSALSFFGYLMSNQGRQAEALSLILRSVALGPSLAQAYIHLGQVHKALGQNDQAIAAYRLAVRIDRGNAIAYHNLGNLLMAAHRVREAEDAYAGAVAANPDQVDSLLGLGEALFAQAELRQAAEAFAEAVRMAPTRADARIDFGRALTEMFRLDDAEQQFCAVLAEGPNPRALHNLGLACYYRGDLANAIRCFRQALALTPDDVVSHFHLAAALLRHGEFAEGWAEYEWRRKFEAHPTSSFAVPEWSGEPLEGRTVLLYGEQGLGDSLQFAGLLPLVAARGGQAMLAVPNELKRLLAGAAGVSRVIGFGEPADYDLHLPLLSLPHRLGIGLDQPPPVSPYLHAPPGLAEHWADRLAGATGLKVGLVWAGAPRRHDPLAAIVDKRRSISLGQLAPLAKNQGISWISLQKGEASAQIPPLADRFPILDLTADLHDFADTAGLVANLDLVITIDSSVAHLAGAMGRPVWILSRFDGCWRWLNGRDDVPWYPSAWLFRQQAPGDWTPVIERMDAALRDVLEQYHRS